MITAAEKRWMSKASTESGAYVVKGMPIEKYHAHNSVSSSSLADYLDNPLLWYYRKEEQLPGKKVTETMRFGSQVHDAIEKGVSQYVRVVPNEFLSKSGSKAGGLYKDWLAEQPAGCHVIKEGEENPFEFIEKHLKMCPQAKPFLEAEGRELSIFWSDFDGVDCRCRIDSLAKHGVIGDYKTTRHIDPFRFRRDMADMYYPERLALYQRGVQELTGDILPVVCVAIENHKPYRVRCYEIDESWLAKCREQLPRWMDEMQNFEPKSVLDTPIETLVEPPYSNYETDEDEDEDDE